MILSIHQPNYIPWAGYFVKMAQSDIFIFLDSVQYPRGASVANRNLIKTPQGAQFLTVPVKKQRGMQRYNEITVAPGWRDKHLKTLQYNYARAPYFMEMFPKIEEKLLESKYLLHTNLSFINWVIELLGIKTKLVFLSSLPQFESLHKNELITALCLHFKANCYLSGRGGEAYNQEELFEKSNLKLQYLDYQPAPYSQLWGDFIANLSIVDMLFNCGTDMTRKLLLKESNSPNEANNN